MFKINIAYVMDLTKKTNSTTNQALANYSQYKVLVRVPKDVVALIKYDFLSSKVDRE